MNLQRAAEVILRYIKAGIVKANLALPRLSGHYLHNANQG